MSELRLALLGSPEVRHDTHLLTFSTRKELALLLYLASEGQACSRQHLIELLWPESDAQRGRAAFRVTLLRLREALAAAHGPDEPVHLLSQGELIRLDMSSGILIDIEALEQASALATGPLRSGASLRREERDRVLAQLRQAIQQVRGPFLDGFRVRDSFAFEEWVDARRSAWQIRLNQIFRTLAALHEEGGEMESAMETVQSWLLYDPLQEEACQRLMRLYAAQGNRAAAVQAFEQYCERLAGELRAEPSPEIRALAAQLRAAPLPRPVPEHTWQPSLSPYTLLEGPLVGRAAEFARLIGSYAQVQDRRAQAVLLEGEAGIGKTRLANEFLAWAAAQGAEVLEGHAVGMGGRLPYQPIIELLRKRLERVNAAEEALDDVWLVELSRILPELHEHYPHLPLPVQEEATARLRLFEAVGRLLLSWAEHTPLVLFVEDLQWADTATLDLLGYLAHKFAREARPVLLLCTLRSEAAHTSGEVREWRNNVQRTLPITRLTLPPFTVEETLQLLSALVGEQDMAGSAGRQVSSTVEQVGRRLYQHTVGHPFYLLETLKLLLERRVLEFHTTIAGTVRLDLSGATPERLQRSELIPATVRTLITARLQNATAAARALLTAAAVLDQYSTFEALWRVADLDEQEGLQALEEAVQDHLLLEQRRTRKNRQETLYLFAHDMIREVVYSEVSMARNQIIHRKAFEILQAVPAPAAALAAHALRAQLLEQAFRYSIQAGDDAMAVFALQEAEVFYQQAHSLLDDGLVVSGSEVERLFVQQARALEGQGHWERAQGVLTDFLAVARRSQDSLLVVGARIRLATLAIQTNELAIARTQLEQALVLAEDVGDVPAQAEVLWNLAQFHAYYGDVRTSVSYGERAVALARQGGEESALLANCYAALGVASIFWGRYPDAIAFSARGHQIVQRLMVHEGKEPVAASIWAGTTFLPKTSYAAIDAFCINIVLVGQVNDGQTITMRSEAEAALALAYLNHDAISIAHLATILNHVYLDIREYERARRVIVEALHQTRAYLSQQLPLLFLYLKLGHTELLLGRWSEAATILRQADEMARDLFPRWRSVIVPWLCAVVVLQQEWEQAEALALLAREIRQAAGAPLILQDFQRWHETEALLRSGHVDLARADIVDLEHNLGTSRRHRVVLLRMRAVLAQWEGELEAAIAHLQEAAALAHAIGLPGEEWLVQEALLTLYEQLEQPEAATLIRQQAAATLQELADRIQDHELRHSFLTTPQARHVQEQ